MILKQQKNFNNYLCWKQTKEFIATIKDNKYALYSLSKEKFITDYIFDKITYACFRHYKNRRVNW